MIYGLYAIKDEKIGFLQVMQDTNDNTALRNFQFAMTRKDTMYNGFKQDFKLYKIGEFDSVSGVIHAFDPVLLASADQFVDEV